MSTILNGIVSKVCSNQLKLCFCGDWTVGNLSVLETQLPLYANIH